MNARLAFFDRARFRLVLGVVLLHAACGYSRYVPWWHARGGPSPLADVLVAGLDVFLMPFLYFIAGCFAPASAAKVSPGGFVARKARRLLAPILPLVFFFLPAMVYAGYRQRTADPAGFFDFWRASLVALTNFRPWCIASLEQALGPQNILSQHHLWFLPLLFLFFLLYRFAPGLRASLAGRPRSLGLAWLAAGAATVAAMTALGSVLPVGIWWRWNILLLCQPVRLPLYAAEPGHAPGQPGGRLGQPGPGGAGQALGTRRQPGRPGALFCRHVPGLPLTQADRRPLFPKADPGRPRPQTA